MTAAVQDLLSAFDAPLPAEQQQVVAEILRRTATTFDELAAELFRAYDAEEAIAPSP